MSKESSINFTNSSFSGNIVQGKVSGNVEANINNESNISHQLSDLLGLIGQLDLDRFEKPALAELETNVSTLKEATETTSESPDKVRTALSAIKSVLSNTAGSTAATGVVATIDRLLSQF